MQVLVHWERRDRVNRQGKICDAWVTYLNWDRPIPRVGEEILYPHYDGTLDIYDDDVDEEEWKVTCIQWDIGEHRDYDLLIVCTLQWTEDQVSDYYKKRMPPASVDEVYEAHITCDRPRGLVLDFTKR